MDNDRQKKILMMRVWVITIIVIIFFLWVYNLKNIWRPITLNNNQSENVDLSKFKNDVNKQMTEINQRLNNLTDLKQQAKNKAGNDLLNNLIKETEKATSTIATATSTSSPVLVATSTLKKNKGKCPAYIDCMPTIGAANSCQIPSGCEGVTVIAY